MSANNCKQPSAVAIALQEQVLGIWERHLKRTPQVPLDVSHPSVANSLLTWPDATRGVPNAWLRGALFAAIQGKERRALKRELLATVSGIEIRFTGWQLNQSDLDVWETIVHLARRQPYGQRLEFSAHAILKALGRATGRSQHEWLKEVVARLYSAGIEITATGAGFSYFGTILKGVRDERSGRYIVELEPRLMAVYQTGWTQIEWSQRSTLRSKPLALWLHGWYSTHADPFPLKIETIRSLSGSNNKSLTDFRRRLSAALDELKAISAIKAWKLCGDLVHVDRRPAPSQQRHLDKRRDKKLRRKI